MSIIVAYGFGAVGTVCYGLATVMEQIGAKREQKIDTFNIFFLLRFLRQTTYTFGIVIDLTGWALLLVAVRSLPLFVVQSFTAASLVVTAIADRYWLKTIMTKVEKLAIYSVVFGLLLVSFSAQTPATRHVDTYFRFGLALSAVIIAGVGILLVQQKEKHYTAVLLSALAGLAFGGTSLVARIITIHHFYGLLTDPLLWLMIVYGLIGLFLFSVALQREKINKVSSSMFATELIVPSLIGIIFVGDKVRDHLWPVMITGMIAVIVGTLLMATDQSVATQR